MHYPGGNATDPIWRVLASSDGISSWTTLKPQHSNPNPKLLANQLWCIDFLTPPTPLIIPHRLPAFLELLMPLKNWCSIHARWSKSSLKHSIRFCGIFSKFKTEFYSYRSVVFWPSTRPNTPFQSDAPEGSDTYKWAVIERNCVGGIWLMKWDKAKKKKIPWYTHRLMHRKRGTCELHDSYFRLMTIKHAIPKIE